ncbi:MAG: ArsR/SmtB family transcription factor, partial [Candidatus Caldatribacteriaceae bacterium]
MVFKALSDRKRLRVMVLLLQEKEQFFVCELADALGESHYNLSKYLRELKVAGLVEEERRGRGVLYRVKPAEDEFTEELYQALRRVGDEEFEVFRERLRLRKSLRGENECVVRSDARWG